MTARRNWQNFIIVFGAASLGISMHLIHIYVKPLKQFMQVNFLFESLCIGSGPRTALHFEPRPTDSHFIVLEFANCQRYLGPAGYQ